MNQTEMMKVAMTMNGVRFTTSRHKFMQNLSAPTQGRPISSRSWNATHDHINDATKDFGVSPYPDQARSTSIRIPLVRPDTKPTLSTAGL
jgi:hypothetical protein